MRHSIIFILFVFLTGCQTQEYYTSDKIFIKKIFKKNSVITIEFFPVMESVYYGSGVNVNLNSDTTIARLTFVRQFREGPKLKVDIPSVAFKNDTSVYMSVNLPYDVKKIIVTPPDTIYYINE